jgi:hypothetical protein
VAQKINTITYEPYYSMALDTVVTGPRHRQQLMNAEGLVDVAGMSAEEIAKHKRYANDISKPKPKSTL